MSRHMGFSLTTDQVRARTKTVTRRLGWLKAKAGDRLLAVEKSMGLPKGEKRVELAEIEIVSVRRERLDAITQEDVIAEGFPELTPAEFVAFFCKQDRKLTGATDVTRIEFRYIEPEPWLDTVMCSSIHKGETCGLPLSTLAIDTGALGHAGSTPEGRWLAGGDTGTSSITIWSVMTGWGMPDGRDPSVPRDPADFGRCHRLLETFPQWRPRMHEVAEKYPEWAGIVTAWDELTALYLEELPTGRAPRCYARMRELSEEEQDDNG